MCGSERAGNLGPNGGEVGDPHTPVDTDPSSIGDQEAAQTSPEVTQVEPPMKTPSAAAVPLEELHEASKDMFVRGAGTPAASERPAIAKTASKELVIKARDAVAATFKAAGLDTVRSSWGRKVDKREALYYLLGWALGRGLLPVTDRPGGAAGELGDKFWVWATEYDKELAAQRKDVSREKSRVAANKLDAFLADAAEARSKILRTVVALGLPSRQSAAATSHHARPKPEPPVMPSSYREPDLAAELAEAEAELHEASIFHDAASSKAERATKAAEKALAADPPPPPGPLREMYLAGEMDAKYVAKAMPERERKRREAEVKRHDAALRRMKETQIAEMEAALEFERANLHRKEARARVAERERKEKLAAELLAAANDKGLAQLRLECLERRMAESAARQAGIEAQLAQVCVATAAAEAAEAPPVGVPVATSSMNVVEGELV